MNVSEYTEHEGSVDSFYDPVERVFVDVYIKGDKAAYVVRDENGTITDSSFEVPARWLTWLSRDIKQKLIPTPRVIDGDGNIRYIPTLPTLLSDRAGRPYTPKPGCIWEHGKTRWAFIVTAMTDEEVFYFSGHIQGRKTRQWWNENMEEM